MFFITFASFSGVVLGMTIVRRPSATLADILSRSTSLVVAIIELMAQVAFVSLLVALAFLAFFLMLHLVLDSQMKQALVCDVDAYTFLLKSWNCYLHYIFVTRLLDVDGRNRGACLWNLFSIEETIVKPIVQPVRIIISAN